MSMRGLAAGLFALACLTPVPAGAQASSSASPSASQPAADTATAADRSRTWIVVGGTTTTLRGDCQEGCPAHGTGAYLHTGSVLAVAGVRISLVAFVAAACFHPAGYHFYFFYIAGLAVSLRLIASSIRPRAATATALQAPA